MTEQEKTAALDALKPGHGLPQPKRYNALREIPADELAGRVVGSLILKKGNLVGYKEVIHALIVNMRTEYGDTGACVPLAVDSEGRK